MLEVVGAGPSAPLGLGVAKAGGAGSCWRVTGDAQVFVSGVGSTLDP